MRKAEKKFLENKNEVETEEDFEKLLLKNPNSSFFWTNYIALGMESEGIEKARSLTERALRVINYKNNNDRLNIWNSYLNLEFNFGTQESLVQVFQKALKNNNPKPLYFHLLNLYRQANNHQMLLDLGRNMVKKNKSSKKFWLEYLRILIDF